jgi:hypothetical protein
MRQFAHLPVSAQRALVDLLARVRDVPTDGER